MPYLYLPIRSAANPPFDWGNPESLSGFYWVVSGMQFKHLMFASFDYQIIHRLFDRFEPTVEIGPAFTILVMWGATIVLKPDIRGKASIIALLLLLFNLYPVMNYHIADTKSFLLPTFISLAILFTLGLEDLLGRLSSTRTTAGPFILLGLVCLVSIPWYANNIRTSDASNHFRPMEYSSVVYESLPENAILIENYYGRVFTMWYRHYIEPGDERKNVAIIYSEHLQFDWGIDNLQRQFPWVEFPEPDPSGAKAIAALIEKNIGKAPIFISREFYTLKGKYRYIPYGEITRVEPLASSLK